MNFKLHQEAESQSKLDQLVGLVFNVGRYVELKFPFCNTFYLHFRCAFNVTEVNTGDPSLRLKDR